MTHQQKLIEAKAHVLAEMNRVARTTGADPDDNRRDRVLNFATAALWLDARIFREKIANR